MFGNSSGQSRHGWLVSNIIVCRLNGRASSFRVSRRPIHPAARKIGAIRSYSTHLSVNMDRMQCFACKAFSPDDKKYCGDCGAALAAVSDLSIAHLDKRIKETIKEQLADQKVVEVELTESVLQRITAWGKLLAYFAGIPVALLVLVLGALGIKQYTDIRALVNAAESKVGPVLERANKQAGEVDARIQGLSKQSEGLQKTLTELEPKLVQIRADSERLAGLERTFDQKLSAKVAGIEGEVNELRQAIAPGVERWSVKTGADADAGLVRPSVVNTTVARLVNLPRPKELEKGVPGDFQAHRLAPHELTIYTVEGFLTGYKLEADGDYHLVLDDGNGANMVVEIPNPDPKFVSPAARWVKEIASARAEVSKKLQPRPVITRGHFHVRVTGVGFYDQYHGQAGMAKNGVELHPVIGIQFLP